MFALPVLQRVALLKRESLRRSENRKEKTRKQEKFIRAGGS